MALRNLAAVIVASVAMATTAYAVPVTGKIAIGGYAQAVGSTSMSGATGISFADAAGSSVSGTSGSLGSYNKGTGSFAALGDCSSKTLGCGTIQNISNFGTSGPITGFLTLATGTGTTVTFDLTTITAVTHGSDPTGGFVTLSASGIINFSGYEATAGSFSLVSVGNEITSFSATTLASATSIPEPMSLALLGGALATVGIIRRKKA